MAAGDVEVQSATKRLKMDSLVEQGPTEDVSPTRRYSTLTTEYATTPMNAVSAHIDSEVPPIAKTQDCWMGIDEAGRGPVCGPMTYGICYGPISGEKRLKGMGFMDSKQLSEDVREKLFKKIKEAEDFIGWSVAVLSPQDISGHMLGRIQYNLNAMSHDCAIGMVHRVIAQGVQLTELYVDTVGKEEFYQEKLERIFPQLKIVVTSKADVKFPIVSAASICAKVTRDHVLDQWKFAEGGDFPKIPGSGYPGDPDTKAWLQKVVDPVFGFPGAVRFSWSTTRKLMEEHCAVVTWEDDEDESDTPSVLSFFGSKQKAAKLRHKFFQSAKLMSTTDAL
eukprot:m.209238 g.209238  ORF g.209238 m.209238 type:complete len:335 (+) comp24500_c0_seq1:35-1039(+)